MGVSRLDGRVQQLHRRHRILFLPTRDLFPPLDGAVHVGGGLKNVSLLASRSEKQFDMVQVLDVLLPVLDMLFDMWLPLLRLRAEQY